MLCVLFYIRRAVSIPSKEIRRAVSVASKDIRRGAGITDAFS